MAHRDDDRLGAGDDDDVSWLRERQRFVAALLAARRAQRGDTIVSLEAWRCGRVQPAAQRTSA